MQSYPKRSVRVSTRKEKRKKKKAFSLLNLCLLSFCLWPLVEGTMTVRRLSKEEKCEEGLTPLTFLQCSLSNSAIISYWMCSSKEKGQVQLISVMISLESDLWLQGRAVNSRLGDELWVQIPNLSLSTYWRLGKRVELPMPQFLPLNMVTILWS